MFWSKIKKTPSVGIEPTAIGLKGQRSTIWAKKARTDERNKMQLK